MKKVWIVVANSGQSKIYTAESLQHLVELKEFLHAESHYKVSDMVADHQGCQTSKNGFGPKAYSPQTPLKVKEATHFAKTIAHYLEEGCRVGKCECIYLTGAPAFLGHLREELGTLAKKCVCGEIAKDLTHLTTNEIRSHLPDIL